MSAPDQAVSLLGQATVLIQDHADTENPPPLRSIKANVLEILPNDDGSYTMPDGSIRWLNLPE